MTIMDLIKTAPPNYGECNQHQSIKRPPTMKQPGGKGDYPDLPDPTNQAIGQFLRRLNGVSELQFEQKLRVVEIIFDWLQENKLYIWSDANAAPFYAEEKSSCICRQFCGNRRNFKLDVMDGNKNTLLMIKRPFNCSMMCGSLFPDSMVIMLGNKQILGFVKEKFNIVPHFAIKDSTGKTMFDLKARLIPMTFHSGDRVQFKVIDRATKKTVAKIIKYWSTCCQEFYTSQDNYTIEFGQNWSPELKALLMGTLFLINMRHFEYCCSLLPKLPLYCYYV